MSERTSPAEEAPRQSSVCILVVDDDPLVAEALEATFELHGWEVRTAATGAEALEAMKQMPDLDAVLLDVHLPDLNGFDVLERSQEAGVVAPVIMISTSAEDEYRLRALDLRARDYFTKPFDPDVLTSRIEEVAGVRRGAPLPTEGRLQLGEVTIDLEQGQVNRSGEVKSLPEPEIRLLRTLLRHRGEVVSRKRLLQEALDVEADAVAFTMTLRSFYETLDLHMERLQERVEANPEQPAFLERVYGQGYRLRAL